jgi:hypothetical protein
MKEGEKEKIVLPLNCYIAETIDDEYSVLLDKVSKDAILLSLENVRKGHLFRCWIPKRFIRRIFKEEVEGEECWLMEIELDCKYIEKAKSEKRLCSCSILKKVADDGNKYLAPALDEISLEPIEVEDETNQIKVYWIEKKPTELEELEKLLKEFGIERKP